MLPVSINDKSQLIGEGEIVSTFKELLEKISDLSYDYPKNILYFRGQRRDYTTQRGRSTLYPSIYRGNLKNWEKEERFRLLDRASKALVDASRKYHLKGIPEMQKKKQVQWSILQHYEICATPLLDVTQSLQVACTFALKNASDFGYIYVLALPYLTNRITHNSEEDLLMIRLLSISPPAAKRPFYQEGYVVGTTDSEEGFIDKGEYDVARRMVGKFRIRNSKDFWSDGFSPMKDSLLYPEDDTFTKIKNEITELIQRGFYDKSLGDFLFLWNDYEGIVRDKTDASTLESMGKVFEKYIKNHEKGEENYRDYEAVRKFRNRLVHNTSSISEEEINKYYKLLNNLYLDLDL